jgi:hypothetical protein
MEKLVPGTVVQVGHHKADIISYLAEGKFHDNIGMLCSAEY